MDIKFESKFVRNTLANMYMCIDDVWYTTFFENLNYTKDKITITFNMSLRENKYFEHIGDYSITFDIVDHDFSIESHDEIIESSVITNRDLDNMYFMTDGNVVIFVQTDADYEMILNLFRL